DSLAFKAGEILGRHIDLNPGEVEKFVIGHDAICSYLLGILLVEFWKHLASALFGAFLRCHTDRAIARKIDEGGGHFAEVTKFQCSLAETAAGNEANRVGGTAVDFDKRDQPLAVFS